MTVRPPSAYRQQDKDPLTAALEHEILDEKVGTLGRLNTKLAAALEKLEAARTTRDVAPDLLEDHLSRAAEALWYVTIQRELCGLVQHKAFYDHCQIPKDVRLRMGPRRAAAPSKAE